MLPLVAPDDGLMMVLHAHMRQKDGRRPMSPIVLHLMSMEAAPQQQLSS